VSGWQRPDEPPGQPPRTYWSQEDADPFSPGALARRGWRLYRSAPRRFVLISAIGAFLQTLAALPTLVPLVSFFGAMVDVMTDFFERVMANPEAYRYADQAAIQADLEARFRALVIPGTETPILTAIGAGVSGIVGLVALAALTATALSVAAGRPIPVPFAVRLVAARAGLVIPIIALGIGWFAVSLLTLAAQTSPDLQAWAGATGSPRSILIASLLSVAAVAVGLGAIVLAVRWALYVPVVLVEAVDVGPGLARAAQLTRGIRIRLGLAMVGILVLQWLATVVVASVVAVAVGLATWSVTGGVAGYLVSGLVLGALWGPWLPAMLAGAYRERTAGATPPTPGGTTEGRPG
jgi:hypothetical protein